MLKNKSRKPIEIKIATVVAVSAILHDSDPMALEAALQEMTGGSADFFDNEFAVIDVAALGPDRSPIDWSQLIELLKKYRLNAVAVRNAPAEMEAGIVASGLSIDHVVAARQEPAAAAPPPAAPVAAPPPRAAASTMIIDTPIRAGQRIYARDADLVITATVNNGAEIIADGSIHVYAPLRGRALAGASGDTSARIFAASMEAELVSIAGVYRTFENGLPPEQKGQPAQIRLSGDRIDVLSLNSASRN
ncbi:septum site-determining protein MinC [Collimonas sp. OK412]|jgi:septum site-determining protein MinC|uniref:septum site-determining protein MinC n=1 Tax=Collimonas sp. (strain OK412) TaxID=1801619 RepID=UPI0008EAD4F5|nr:septum site-determining protein MinC [Collimonas sp. OK412]SFC55365.1 septum site-determining protein MinC [Collimonas sp. OK412]